MGGWETRAPEGRMWVVFPGGNSDRVGLGLGKKVPPRVTKCIHALGGGVSMMWLHHPEAWSGGWWAMVLKRLAGHLFSAAAQRPVVSGTEAPGMRGRGRGRGAAACRRDDGPGAAAGGGGAPAAECPGTAFPRPSLLSCEGSIEPTPPHLPQLRSYLQQLLPLLQYLCCRGT